MGQLVQGVLQSAWTESQSPRRLTGSQTRSLGGLWDRPSIRYQADLIQGTNP